MTSGIITKPPLEDCSGLFPWAGRHWPTAIVQGAGRGPHFRDEETHGRSSAGLSLNAGLQDPRLQACSSSQAASTH